MPIVQRIEEKSWEITIANMALTGVQAHSLGFTPDAAKVSFKPKTGTDPGGATIVVTTDSTNITLTTNSPPFGGSWVFEVQYVEAV